MKNGRTTSMWRRSAWPCNMTCGQFLRFVEDGGYKTNSLWSEDGLAGGSEEIRRIRSGTRWFRRLEGTLFDRWNDLNPDSPVVP